jgi:hypothetical protein
MLYEMVTGLLPFKGETDQAVIYSILNNDPEPMTALRTGVPMELERIATKMMAKRTEERYQDATDLLVDLRALRRHMEGSTETVAVDVSHLGRPAAARQRWRQVALIMGVVAILVIAGIFYTKLRRQGLDVVSDRVVVAAFENRTGDESFDAIGQMAADWITQGLSQTDVVEVVPTRRRKPALPNPSDGCRRGAAHVCPSANKRVTRRSNGEHRGVATTGHGRAGVTLRRFSSLQRPRATTHLRGLSRAHAWDRFVWLRLRRGNSTLRARSRTRLDIPRTTALHSLFIFQPG